MQKLEVWFSTLQEGIVIRFFLPGHVLGEVYSEISEEIEDIPESSRSVWVHRLQGIKTWEGGSNRKGVLHVAHVITPVMWYHFAPPMQVKLSETSSRQNSHWYVLRLLAYGAGHSIPTSQVAGFEVKSMRRVDVKWHPYPFFDFSRKQTSNDTPNAQEFLWPRMRRAGLGSCMPWESDWTWKCKL